MTVNSEGYRLIIRHGHPLAGKYGRVLEHRSVLFDALGPDEQHCHWCSVALTWLGNSGRKVVVDHLDDDRLNNCLKNLVPSCRDCNARRGRSKTALGALAAELTGMVGRGPAQAVLGRLAETVRSGVTGRRSLLAFELEGLAALCDEAERFAWGTQTTTTEQGRPTWATRTSPSSKASATSSS